ncbi:N/A [soil metagenome]
MNTANRSNTLLASYLSSPLFLLLGLVILVPEIIAVVMSFTNYAPGLATEFVGFDNYVDVVTDPQFWNAAKNTLVFVVAVVALQIVIALAICMLLARTVKRTAVWLAIVLVPSAMSPAVLGVTWKFLFDQDAGPINYLLGLVGIERVTWFAQPGTAMVAVVIAYVWFSVPSSVILLYPAVSTVPSELYEAAQIDGAGPMRTFTRVVLPTILPAVAVASIFRMIIAIRAFGEVYVLSGGGPSRGTEILGLYLYRIGFEQFEWGRAAAVGIVMLVITVVAASPQIRLLSRQMVAGDRA